MQTEQQAPGGQGRQPGAPFIEAKGLSLKTPMGQVYENVSFSVDKGKVCCVFGEQGSGKTSVMLTACGRMKANRGSVVVGGYDVHKKFRKVRQMSGLSFIPGLNDVQSFLEVKRIAAAELALAGKRGNKANTDRYLQDWNFSDKADVKFKDLDAYDATRFGIILAMAGDPELLVVDDIQTNVTQHQSIKLMKFLCDIAASRGTTVLVACTEYEIARHADCVVVMDAESEDQRRAVIRQLGVPSGQVTPVVGSGNGAKVDVAYAAGSASAAPAAQASSNESEA